MTDISSLSNTLNWRLLPGSHSFPGPDGGTRFSKTPPLMDGAHHSGCPSTEDCPVCGYDCAGADSQPVECPKRTYPKEDRP